MSLLHRRSSAIHAPLREIATLPLILAVRLYQLAIRPMLGGSCRYVPGCSEYFIEAVTRHGPVRGGWMGLRRICRCHPWARGGIDPVP